MTLEELDKDINKKIAENEEFVRYTFFELKVRHNIEYILLGQNIIIKVKIEL